MFLILTLVGNVSFEGLGREMDAIFQTPLLSLKHLGLPWASHSGAVCSWSASTQLHGLHTELWPCCRNGAGPWLYPWSELYEWTFLTALRKSGEKSLMTEDCLASGKTSRRRNAVDTNNSCLCISSPMPWCYLVQVWIKLVELCALRRCCCWRLSNFCGSGLRA